MNLEIRLEKESDWHQVETLTRKAFWETEKADKTGLGCNEHYLVHLLRKDPVYIPELDFVAVLNDRIIGNIMYSKAYVEDESGAKHNVLTFGPLSVLPDYQKKGVGQALLQHSLDKSAEMGHGAVVIFGHPEYYPRFGFKEAGDYGITTKGGTNFPPFMALELKKRYLDNINGKFFLADVFNVNDNDAKEYDRQFQTE